MMDRLSRYIDLYWPIEACNFNCEYCYVHQHRENKGTLYKCTHTSGEIRNALSRKRLGGTCLINICSGGETLLETELIEIVYALLEEGHYVSVVTNGSVKKCMMMFFDFPEALKKHLFVKFSFHYEELRKNKKIDDFFHIVKMTKENHISYTLELPGYDGFIPHIKDILSVCNSYGEGKPHVTVLRDENKPGFNILSQYSIKELKEIWKDFDSSLFQFRLDVIEHKYKGFCYAGDWTFTANIETGEIRQCYYEQVIGNLYENVEKPIQYSVVGNRCHSEYCYNCHAFLTLGDMPEFHNNLTYADTRDRADFEWLNDDMRFFMGQKLYHNHKCYSAIKRYVVNNRNRKTERKLCSLTPFEMSIDVITRMKSNNIKINYVVVEARHKVKMLYSKIPKDIRWLYSFYDGKQIQVGEDIQVIALKDKNENADANEIGIVGAIIDDTWYDAVELFQRTWLVIYRTLRWRENDKDEIDHMVEGKIPSGIRHVKLVLEKNRWRGCCQIVFRKKRYKLDCWGEGEDNILLVDIG